MTLTLQLADRIVRRLQDELKIHPDHYDEIINTVSPHGTNQDYAARILRVRHLLDMSTLKEDCTSTT